MRLGCDGKNAYTPAEFMFHLTSKGSEETMADATTTKGAQTERKVTIDGVEYTPDQLSEKARQQLGNLRTTDQEIMRLEQKLAIYRTARAAYAQALKAELREVPEATH